MKWLFLIILSVPFRASGEHSHNWLGLTFLPHNNEGGETTYQD